jgi:xanthine dehydrogenase accessory factor
MYKIAPAVLRYRADGEPVSIVRVARVVGFSSRGGAEAAAVAPSRVQGSIFGGAIDEQLAGLVAEPGAGRLDRVPVSDSAAQGVGLSCGGLAELAVQNADDLPAQLWDLLARQEPVCLVSDLNDAALGATEVYTRDTVFETGPRIAHLFRSGVARTAVLDDQLVTVLWPQARLVVVGAGTIADALRGIADVLGWATTVVEDGASAAAAISPLSSADAVVVLSHADAVYGPALLAALDAGPGYIGALGSRRTQTARTEWLAERGIADVTAIHGPAGLDIGANTPGEIAVAIMAEALAARSGAQPGSLRDRSGPIH